MKVAYVTTRFPVRSETFTCTDIRVLRESGVDVSVYTMRTPEDDPVRLLEERRLSKLVVDQGTISADVRGLVMALGRPLLLLRLFRWLVACSWRRPSQLLIGLLLIPRSVGILVLLEREQPDVVHLFWGHYPCMVGYLVLETMPGVAVSLFLGAYDLIRAFGGTAWVAQRAHLVSTHARCNFPSIEALGVHPGRIHLAYRGIDLAVFSNQSVQKVRGRIVSAGRLDVGKGMDDVLRVFRDVLLRWPEASLRVFGAGPERAKLEGLARDLGIAHAATFRGHVSQRNLADELLAAEVFLFMSWEESERLPNVVKEAMAAGCVCVVAATPGIGELLEHGRHGFQIAKGDVIEAAARVGDILSGCVDVVAIRRASASRVARRFDVRVSMQSYLLRWQDARSPGAGASQQRADTDGASAAATAK